jgi:hypothetical protein
VVACRLPASPPRFGWVLGGIRCAPGRVAGLYLLWPPAAPGAFRVVEAAVSVHGRSVRDRYAARRLYALLAGWRPPRESPEQDRQSTVTAQLDELHPRLRVSRHSLQSRRIEIRGRVA